MEIYMDNDVICGEIKIDKSILRQIIKDELYKLTSDIDNNILNSNVVDNEDKSTMMSGHHEEIRKWRLKQSLQRTWLRRPELLEGLALTDEQRRLLKEAQAEHNS